MVNGVNGNNSVNKDMTIAPNPEGKAEEKASSSLFDDYFEWNSYETLDKLLSGQEIQEFEMFDAVGKGMGTQEYVNSLVDFSQGIIDKYDENKDGTWSLHEFNKMMTNGKTVTEYINEMDPEGILSPEEKQQLTIEFMEMQKTLYSDFQMDNDNRQLSAEEFGSQLFMADMNQDGKVNGKLNFISMNTFATDPTEEDLYNTQVQDRKNIFDSVIKPNLNTDEN